MSMCNKFKDENFHFHSLHSILCLTNYDMSSVFSFPFSSQLTEAIPLTLTAQHAMLSYACLHGKTKRGTI